MNVRQSTAAAALIGGAILTGSAAEAQPASPAQSLSQMLGLPLGKTIAHFNRATNTAVTENCEIKAPNVVECRLRVMSNTAQIDARQVHQYSIDPQGGIRVSVRDGGQTAWTPDTFKYDYQPARKDAVSPATLSEGSPLYAPEQNGVGRVEAKAGVARISSVMPLSENRTLRLSTTFDEAAGSVSFGAMSSIAFNGSTASAGTSFNRAYNSYDGEHYDKYTAQAAQGPVFGRNP